jgi:hypothetical protein
MVVSSFEHVQWRWAINDRPAPRLQENALDYVLGYTVRVHPGAVQAPFAFPTMVRFCAAVFYGRAGRLATLSDCVDSAQTTSRRGTGSATPAATIGLGCIVAFHHRPSTLHLGC